MVKIIDTNLLLRLILNDIPEQTNLVRNLVRKGSCKVLDISVFECVFALKNNYQMPLSDINNNLRTVLLNSNIEFNLACLLALNQYCHKPSVSFADWYLLEAAKQQKGQLYTFDKDLIKQSGGVATQPS